MGRLYRRYRRDVSAVGFRVRTLDDHSWRRQISRPDRCGSNPAGADHGLDDCHFVRAVATQTMREAKNRDEFISHAEKILGFPIEVISGREEARLIYSGVVNLLPQSDEKRLVIDIGGRSTEIILGKGYKPQTMESYRVGSVKWSMKYFSDGQFSPSTFERAEVAAKAVLDEALSLYPKNSWDLAYGSSGTIGAVADVLQAAGWPEGIISREGLDWLKEKLFKAERIENLRLEGVKEDRKPVIGGGLAVAKNTMIGGDVTITSTTQSTNSTTASLILHGGASIAKDMYVYENTTVDKKLTTNSTFDYNGGGKMDTIRNTSGNSIWYSFGKINDTSSVAHCEIDFQNGSTNGMYGLKTIININ